MDSDTKALLIKKMDNSKKVIREALEKFEPAEIAITWTGGKDSTLVLWLFLQVCAEDGTPLPVILSIDEFDHFDEIHDFLDQYSNEWGLEVFMGINQDVVDAAGGQLGAMVQVADLNERNRAEIQRLGWEEEEFPFEAESYVGNHLMKTVPFNQFLKDKGIKAVIQGLRWDEQAARAEDEYFTFREEGDLSPAHWRINPILHFTERDVWNTNHGFGVPYNTLYAQGYRSLGAKTTSQKFGDLPAWEQDLENTGERDGRRQDKEAAMDKLRSLGYM